MVLTLILFGLIALLVLYFYECYIHNKTLEELQVTKYKLQKLSDAVNKAIKK